MKALNSVSRTTPLLQIVAILLFGFAPAVARAQSPVQPAVVTTSQPAGMTLTLDDAVKIAEGQSETVNIARAGVQRTAGQLLQAHSQYLPQISGSGSYTRTLKSQYSSFASTSTTDTTTTKVVAPPPPCDAYLKDASASVADRLAGLEQSSRCSLGLNPFASLSSLPFGQANQYNLGLSFSQNIFTGGRIGAQSEAAAASGRSAKIELTAQRAQVILDVTQAYYDAALADRLVTITDASFTQTENVLQQVQLNKNVGNTSEFELLRAQVTRDNQRPQVIQRRSDREVAYLRLKQLLNIPAQQPLNLTTSIEDTSGLPAGIHLTGLTVTPFDAPDTATSDRAAVREAAEAVQAQEQLLSVARSERLPSVSVSSQYGGVAYPTSGLPGRNDFRANWTIGVAAQVPISTGGRIRGDEMVAQANLAESRARLQQTREFASLDANVAINALNQAMSAWEASRGTSDQATKAYSIAEVRYREGISTQTELTDQRIALEQSNANRALAARDLQIARMKLALLANLPLQSSTSTQTTTQAQSTQQQSTQQQSTTPQQSTQQQTQSQQGTLANQQIPPGL